MENIISQSTTKSGKIVSFRYPTIDVDEILMYKKYKFSLVKGRSVSDGEGF
jgi:hypothetical protein